jgi:rhamnose transport system permease protein
LEWLKSWEGLLLILVIVVIIINALQSPFYLDTANQINLFQLSIEKVIVAVTMGLIIINGEIDLSVASIMGLSACVLAFLHAQGVSFQWAILAALLTGVLSGAFNGFWVAHVGLPSLVVTLAGLIGYRGLARVLLEDRSIGNFPEWFDALGQDAILGPVPLSLIVFLIIFVIGVIVLHFATSGRYIYVIGNNKDVARYSGINVKRVKMALFIASGTVAALAGIFFASRLGAVRGNTAEGFELDIITIVLLGGVSIFGGKGTLYGVGLAILLILNLRNGMSLANITGNTQTGVVGTILILSVLTPNLLQMFRERWHRYRLRVADTAQETG